MKKWTTFVFCLTLLLSGCQFGQNQNPNRGATVQEKQRVPQTAERNPKNQSPQAKADRLVQLAVNVPQVNDATAIVFGNMAIVGIDVNAKLDRPRVGTIKYTVAEALKKDPQGANAVVVADPDIVQRLREIRRDVERGRPIAGFAEELADIAGRAMPQMPRSTTGKNRDADQKIQRQPQQQQR